MNFSDILRTALHALRGVEAETLRATGLDATALLRLGFSVADLARDLVGDAAVVSALGQLRLE